MAGDWNVARSTCSRFGRAHKCLITKAKIFLTPRFPQDNCGNLCDVEYQTRVAVVRLNKLGNRRRHAVGWNGTIAGEAVDLHSEQSTLDFDTLEFIHSRKTGALFAAAAAVGAMLANVHPAPLQRIEVFAKNLGLAFQITDDILDVTSTPETLGKDVGKDEQRLTFVKLAGIEGARKLSEELVDTSLAALDPLGAAARPLRDLAVIARKRVR